tara:strand:- start:3745 stop:4365 length:621 start_codon:yes stop_codon:yes gene_type:complete
MNLKYNYWVFPEAIPHNFCDQLIQYGEDQLNPNTARTENFQDKKNLNKKDLLELHELRNSSIAWIDESWIWKMVQPFIKEANSLANWNFQLDFSEPAQWTKYSRDQHYSWHTDQFTLPYNKPRTKSHGMIRKLSMTLALEDGDTFDGGDLQFRFLERTRIKQETVNVARKKGTLVVFPSFVWHRVTPVTKGTRYSLVVWTLGNPYI